MQPQLPSFNSSTRTLLTQFVTAWLDIPVLLGPWECSWPHPTQGSNPIPSIHGATPVYEVLLDLSTLKSSGNIDFMTPPDQRKVASMCVYNTWHLNEIKAEKGHLTQKSILDHKCHCNVWNAVILLRGDGGSQFLIQGWSFSGNYWARTGDGLGSPATIKLKISRLSVISHN